MIRPLILISLVGALALPSATLFAQASPIETRLRDQLKSTVSQLRELQNAQASLQAAKLAAEQERDALKAKQSSTPKAAAVDPGLSRQVAQLRADNAQAQASASRDRAELEKANGIIAQANAELTKLRDERNQLLQTTAAATGPLATAKAALAACYEKNQALIMVSNEILEAYEKKRGSRLAFITGSRVKLENAAQDMGDKVHQTKCAPLAE
jgi:chromosome segregation ATPase